MSRSYLPIISLAGLFSALTFILGGCNSAPPKHMMDIQAGETFTLNQTLKIPADSARTYIQYGKATGGGFDHYGQHCRLEVRTLSEKVQTVSPDRFTITRVSIGEEAIAQNRFENLYAGLQPLFVGTASAFGDNERTPTMDYVHLYLESKTQPDVLRLTCSGSLSDGDLADAPQNYRPQREQINQILGAVGHL